MLWPTSTSSKEKLDNVLQVLQHPSRWAANTPQTALGRAFPHSSASQQKSVKTLLLTLHFFLFFEPIFRTYFKKVTDRQRTLRFVMVLQAKRTGKRKIHPICSGFLVKCYFFSIIRHTEKERLVPALRQRGGTCLLNFLTLPRQRRVLNRNLPASVKPD